MALQPLTCLPHWLHNSDLIGMLRGVERECLRMQPNGFLAQSPHPQALGSTLTHPYITTDYSESLLELITPPKHSVQAMLTTLGELHELVYINLEHGELLWPLSMPCMLSKEDADIPLGNYGSSNIGKLKTLYRHGLGLRYGRRMQTIAGLHYNLSFPDALFEKLHTEQYPELTFTEAKNAAYLGLVRNYKRLSSMVLYLLGASPSVCPCFLKDKTHHLQTLDEKTLYMPHATSLRMGKFGYQNNAQDDLNIQYNNLTDYVSGLRRAISIPHDEFTQLGVDDAQGNPTQINDHILQIENEFYSTIRPKQVAKSGESPTHALEDRGIAYIELRSVDVDPFSDVGIREQHAYFLEVLALYCLLLESPPLYKAEETELSQNQDRVVNFGRDPQLEIQFNGNTTNFRLWMKAHLTRMLDLADMMDSNLAEGSDSATHHRSAIDSMLARIADVGLTPSAQVMAETEEAGGIWRMGSHLAQHYAAHYATPRMAPDKLAEYTALAKTSRQQQTELEQKDDIPFAEYVKNYR